MKVIKNINFFIEKIFFKELMDEKNNNCNRT